MKRRETSGNQAGNSSRICCPKIVRVLFTGIRPIPLSDISVNVFLLLAETEFPESGYHLITIMLFTPCSPCQQPRTNDAASHICNQIIPSRLSSGQVGLMPFIQRPHKQCRGKPDNQPAPILQPACQPHPACEQGKNTSMNQFVPWRGDQIHSNRMCSQYKQAQHNPQRQQHGCSSHMAR